MRVKGIIDYDCTNYREPCLTIEFPYCDFKCDKLNGCHVCQNSALAHAPDIEVSGEQIWKMYQDNPLKDERISSPEDLSKILMSGRYKYVYIHYTNTSFWKTFGQLFENVNLDELRLWKWEKHLYEVVPREDGLGVTLKMLNVTTNN